MRGWPSIVLCIGASTPSTADELHPPRSRKAIAMLVKAYAEGQEDKYTHKSRPLHFRLLSVARQAWARNYDHLIFHEANLPDKHKALFQSWSPDITLRFINVQPTFDRGLAIKADWSRQIAAGSRDYRARAIELGARCWDSKNDTLANVMELQAIGYKSMCNFWYADFLNYTREYDSLYRIDDDCVLEPVIPRDPDPGPGTTVNAARKMRYEKPAVQIGVASFFGRLSRAHNCSTQSLAPKLCFRGTEAQWVSPYSNVVWFNLTWARHHRWLYDSVAETNCIYHDRWGDHILWGATLRLLGVDFKWMRGINMPYCHASSNAASLDNGCSLEGCKGRRDRGCIR